MPASSTVRYLALKPPLERSSADSKVPYIRKGGGLRIGMISCIAAILLIVTSFYTHHHGAIVRHKSSGEAFESPLPLPSDPTLQQCPSPTPLPASPPTPVNIWSSLSLQEIQLVHSFLEIANLNLTLASTSTLSDNVIFLIEAYYPSKASALAYLDSSDLNAAAPPQRWARVTIHHGAEQEPIIRDYLVGPLNEAKKDVKMTQLTEIYHNPNIPYHARGFVNTWELTGVLSRIAPELNEATEDLFGGSVRGLSNDTLVCGSSGPFSFDGSFRRTWVSWRRNVAGPWLHPLNFFQYIDISGTDVNQWKVLKVVYNHQIFNGVEGFMNAWRAGKLDRLPENLPGHNRSLDDVSWTARNRPNVPPRDLDHLPGPRSVSFKGLRFRFDRERQYISWMGWGFYLGFDRDMGLSLWDVRIKDERIIYQLAPQEAMAQYAGNDPMQTSTAWLDRYFGMGAAARDLIPGYDCPHEAVYLPTLTYSTLGIAKRERAICIFEHNTGKPITRHTGFLDGESGAVLGYVLTVRSVSTVGNYDYRTSSFDYVFQLDGTLEVRVSASGYLQGGYWEPKQDGYGGRIHDFTMGNLHDHVINFKVDLDIAGMNNSLLSTTTAQETVTQPWFDDDWGSEVIQQKITKTYIDNEDDAKLLHPVNYQGSYSIVNRGEKNKWGHPRGYALHAGNNAIHNTVVGSKRLLNNANWARYNLAVSKRKDNEPSSSSMWNMNLPGTPTVDFHRFFDGESLEQEDLVMWVNVGTHHLPQAEDTPNTKTNVATSSFVLTPLNFFDYDISLESLNAVILNMPKEPSSDPYPYDDYGVDQSYTCIPEKPEKLEYRTPETYTIGANGEVEKMPLLGKEELMKNTELYHRIKVGL